jgi:hypothetical protein
MYDLDAKHGDQRADRRVDMLILLRDQQRPVLQNEDVTLMALMASDTVNVMTHHAVVGVCLGRCVSTFTPRSCGDDP